MPRLVGKAALIIGGTCGVGLETAQQFMAEGARVAVTGVNPANLADARAILGPEAVVLQVDAGDVASQAKAGASVKAVFGKLDIVFINADLADFRPIEPWDETRVDRSLAVNLKGPFFLIKALLPLLNIRRRSCSTLRSTLGSTCPIRPSVPPVRPD